MIYTGNFGRLRYYSDAIPISICLKKPKWFTGASCYDLAPNRELLRGYKNGTIDEEQYRTIYMEWLAHTSHERVVFVLFYEAYKHFLLKQGLGLDDPFFDVFHHDKTRTANLIHDFVHKKDLNVVLLCYENPDSFCHRHLAAEWFRSHGTPCEEYLPYPPRGMKR